MDEERKASQTQVGPALRLLCILSGKDELTKGGCVRLGRNRTASDPKAELLEGVGCNLRLR